MDLRDVFTKEMYICLASKIKGRGTHHLFFGNTGIDIVRSDGIDKRDARLWIAKYKSKTLPPYELVLMDIDYAMSEYERESEKVRGGQVFEGVG